MSISQESQNQAFKNPLLNISLDIPFDQLHAEHIEPAIKVLLEEAKQSVDLIAKQKGPRTFKNTLGELETATEKLQVAITIVGHLESVATSPALREVYNRVRPQVSAFFSSLPLHSELYRAIVEFAQSDEGKALVGVQARLLEKTLREFRRHGAELSSNEKERLQAIDIELTKKTTSFTQNVLDETNEFELYLHDEERLLGLPKHARAAARQAAQEKGKEGWRFTLHAPSLSAVLTYLQDRSVRETMWRAYHSRAASGSRDNRDLILQILRLRKEKASLLGHADFADFVLEERMAKSGERAMTFVVDLDERTRNSFERENRALSEFQAKNEKRSDLTLQPWDVAYYAEKMRKEEFDFDEEELRVYFPVNAVLKGLFSLAESLYGISVRPRDVPTWHSSVRAYGIYQDSRMLASFYVDLYPRENKRGGAWMNALISGGDSEPHLGLFCANLTPPVGNDEALLRHREVETLFHEFGHLLHHAFSEVPIKSLGGANVAWDFVELPSQIMENFCWERASLDLFARHVETHEPIPEELFQKMKRARTFRAASAQMRQIGFATMDLKIHREFDPHKNTKDMMNFARDVLAHYSPTPYPAEYAMICGFSHLFSSPTGYAAGYYSYKWAEVLDADAFGRFRDAGVLSRDIGMEFRKAILAKGNSEEPDLLYRAFMGRDPKLDALLERYDLS